METARKVALLIIGLVVLAIAVSEFRKQKDLADSTLDEIEGALGKLDPATRAAVVARFAVDEAKDLKQR